MPKKQNTIKMSVLAISVLMLMACGITSTPTIAREPSFPQTAAAQTWSVMQAIAQLSATATYTAAPITDTPTPTDTPRPTLSPTPTQTPIPPITQRPTHTPTNTPTRTPIPTSTPYYRSGGGGGGGGRRGGGGGGGQAPCYAANIIRDVTIPNGEVLLPGTSFTKIWEVENVGSCSWQEDARLVIANGSDIDGVGVPLNESVRPGESVRVSANIIAPLVEGSFTARFRLRLERGAEIGPEDSRTFDARFQVRNLTSGVVWDFVEHACTGTWKNGSDRRINCPNRRQNNTGNGVVTILSPAHLEDGASYPQALLTFPPTSRNSRVTGIFPGLLIQAGDRLKATVGCLAGAERCNVAFEIYYSFYEGDYTRVIEPHTEIQDGVIHTIFDQRIDTPGIVNNYISFAFRVTTLSHPEDSAATWIELQIYR